MGVVLGAVTAVAYRRRVVAGGAPQFHSRWASAGLSRGSSSPGASSLDVEAAGRGAVAVVVWVAARSDRTASGPPTRGGGVGTTCPPLPTGAIPASLRPWGGRRGPGSGCSPAWQRRCTSFTEPLQYPVRSVTPGAPPRLDPGCGRRHRRRIHTRRSGPALPVLGAVALVVACSSPAPRSHAAIPPPRPAAPSSVAAAATTTTTVASTTTTTTILSPPSDLAPLGPMTYAGEGHWVPAGRAVDGAWPVWVTTLRPPGGGAAAGIARMDTTHLRVVLYAGTSQPSGTWTYQGQVAPALVPRLVAAFNGGFEFGASGGGFFADGRASPPLVNGAASLVVRSDGSATVLEWGRDPVFLPAVAQVRQNLTLLVDHGAPTPAVASGYWGATITHGIVTWRSAVGSDAAGHLFFVGGPGLTPQGLAALLVAAGAEEGMEFDVNPQWVVFASFTDASAAPLGTFGAKLLPSMNYPAHHFFSPDWRDFVALFSKP
jgi:hypothetical protein